MSTAAFNAQTTSAQQTQFEYRYFNVNPLYLYVILILTLEDTGQEIKGRIVVIVYDLERSNESGNSIYNHNIQL
jgi:hypothetical protein